MEAPRNFKFDVRIRARLLNKKHITDSEVGKHLEALPDLDAACDTVTLSQPAVGIPPERPRPIPQARPAPRFVAPPAPISVDDAWDDEDDDELEPPKKAKAAPVAPATESEGAAPVPAPAPAQDDDEDDVDAGESKDGGEEE